MAINQIPYTNVHELNLDWILKKIQEFEQRLEAIEDYSDEIAELQHSVSSLRIALENLKDRVNNSLTALNARCTALEDEDDRIKVSLNLLYESVNEQISDIEAQFNAINASLRALKSYNDSSNVIVLNEAKEYTREKVRELLEYFSDPKSIYVVNPWNNQVCTIQDFINYLYNFLHFAGMTANEFDILGLSASEFDSIGLTCEEFDAYGRWAIFFRKAYVTEPELNTILLNYATKEDIEDMATKADLEHYATLNDIKVHNPCTGILGSVQEAIISLAALHQNGLTATQFDNADLTAAEIDALEITAFMFDFYGYIIYITENIIIQPLGITADQWQSIVVGSGGQLFTTDI